MIRHYSVSYYYESGFDDRAMLEVRDVRDGPMAPPLKGDALREALGFLQEAISAGLVREEAPPA